MTAALACREHDWTLRVWELDGSGNPIGTPVELTSVGNINGPPVQDFAAGTYAVFELTNIPRTGALVRLDVQELDEDDTDRQCLENDFGINSVLSGIFVSGTNACPTTASLGDRVWEDLNADGIQDCEDTNGNGILGDVVAGQENDPNVSDQGPECTTGIPNVHVTLLENPDGDANCADLVETGLGTLTDESGFYEFTDLDPNKDYCVLFDKTTVDQNLACNPIIGGAAAFSPQNQGANDAVDSDANVTTGQTGNISLLPGQFDRTWDAGVYCPAKIGDSFINDLNRDGIQDPGEPGIAPPQTVELLECVNGVPGDVIEDQLTMGGDGMYMFNPLPPGEYAVRFSLPDGYEFSDKKVDGSTDVNDCDVNPATGTTDCVILGSNEYNDRVDACAYLPPTAGLGNFVWEDKNADGIQDAGEPGIPDVPVTLEAAGPDGNCGTGDDMFVADTETGVDGMYKFEELDGGLYCVTFDKPTDDYCEFGGPEFTLANQGSDDSVDSDANPVTGQTGIIDLPNGVFDPDWDAGIYCPAKLGDQVWNDTNPKNGIQDNLNNIPGGELGASGVTVNLLDCNGEPVVDLDGFGSMTTDDVGMYMFRVAPGDYIVEFVAPADRVFTEQDAGNDDAVDSDANPASGRTACITVPSNTYDDTWDAGLIPPSDCGIAVEKTCELIEPAPAPFTCDGKVDELQMVWDGAGELVSVEAPPGGDGTPVVSIGTEIIDGLVRQVVTVTGYQPSTNDVVWEYTSTSGSGTSTFHLSCSDDGMDGPEDCEMPQGDGKSGDGTDPTENPWLLEGLKTDSGDLLNCNLSAPAVGVSECEFQQQIASCETLPSDPDILTFRYTGGGCAASDNAQKPGDATCEGSIDPTLPVTVVDADKVAYLVAPGGTIDVPRNDADKLTLSNSGGTESLELHTSCSQPLQTGDVYGSLTLVALDGVGLGRDVLYSYLVKNMGTDTITDISVVDDPLGDVPGSPIASLSPGSETTLSATAYITETTTNTVTVTGIGVPNAACSATASATVTALPPPPCEVAIALDDLSDDKLKYKVTNTSGRVATLGTFQLDFPPEYGVIKEVKLDGGVYKASDSALVVGPGVLIGPDDWTESDVSKRQLDPGETRNLEVVFTEKADGFGWLDVANAGMATFEEGCEVHLLKPAGCDIDKPTELVFGYTGAACGATSNDQEGSFECTESAVPPGLGDLWRIAMDKDADKITAEVNGAEVRIYRSDTLGKEFPSEIQYTIEGTSGTQSHVLHTSCSKDLSAGDVFGGLTLELVVPKTN